MSDLLRRRGMMIAQSQQKTMQLLAEYTVTEPVHSFQIPFTEEMKSCKALYVSVEIAERDQDWLYIAVGNASLYTISSSAAISGKATAAIVHAAEIDGTQFNACTFLWTSFTQTGVTVSIGTPSSLRIYQYTADKMIYSGTVKIYGEV